MGVVSFLHKFNTKKRSVAVSTEKLMLADQALGLVFRTIALEKNQMLYPVQTNAISHKEHQAIIVDAAQKLVVRLQTLVDNQDAHPTPQPLDFITTIQALNNAIDAYQEDEHTLPQLLLVCSSIKTSLEKNS